MSKKIKYSVDCYIPGQHHSNIIECREMAIYGGAYTFWDCEYGETNRLIASYPIMFTIIENTETDE